MRMLTAITIGLLACGFSCNKKITTVVASPPEGPPNPAYITASPCASQGPPPVLTSFPDLSGGGAVFFDFDSYEITPEAAAVVERLASAAPGTGAILVDGYCDERGSDDYNYKLGMLRAQAVAAALGGPGGTGRRVEIKVRSFGENGLVRSGCPPGDEACHAENRRVEIHGE